MGEQWYYSRNGEQLGPVSMAELQRLAAGGQLQPDDLVWRDGMHAWIPARTARGLFPNLQPELAPVETEAIPVALPVEVAPAHAPAHTPRPQPRQGPPPGMSTGAKVALIGGMVVGLVIFVVVIVLAVRSGAPRDNEHGTYVVHLNPGNTDSRFARFVEDRMVTITVISDHFNSNVDLAVYDSRGMRVALDNRAGANCFVQFVPRRTDTYRIEVVNHGPAPNRSVVRYN